MSEEQGSALAVVLHDSRSGGSGAPNPQLLAAFDDKLRVRRKRMVELCKQPAAKGQVKTTDFDREFDQLKSYRDAEHFEGDDVDRTLAELDDLLATAERNVDWSIRKAEQDKIAVATFNHRMEEARSRVADLCRLPEAEGVVSPADFTAPFATLEGMAKGGQYDGSEVDDAFGVLGKAVADAEQKVVQAKEATARRLRELQELTSRTSQLRRRVKALCEKPEAEGVVAATEFDGYLKALLSFSENGPLSGSEVEKVFNEFETAITEADEKVGVVIRKAEELKQAKIEFAGKQTLLDDRVRVLVSGGFAEQSVFDTAMQKLESLLTSGEVVGEGADKALQDAEDLISGEEKKAAEQQKKVDLYAAKLKIFDQKLSELGTDSEVGETELEGPKKRREEAEEAVKKRDFDNALKCLERGAEQLGRLEKKLAERKEVMSDLNGNIESLASGVLGSLKLSAQEVIDSLTEEQQIELCLLERKRLTATKTQKPKLGQQIRALFDQYKEENEPEEEDEPEPEPEPEAQETQAERRKRIHQLKLRNKNAAALVALDAEGEIFRITRVFRDGKAKKWKVPGTDAFINDYCSGYNIFLRNGPNEKGEWTQYNKMILHFHCSDKQHTQIECAHFKKSHSGGDHDHYGMTRALEIQAMQIVNKYV